MVSYTLLVPLAVTSSNNMIQRLGFSRWQSLHRLTYAVAIGGVIHYLFLVKKGIYLKIRRPYYKINMDYKFKILFILILSILLIYGLKYIVSAGPKQYQDISVSEFYGKLKGNPGMFILDVRTPEEYRELHIPDTSRIIPVGELKRRIDELKGLDEEEIYVICRSGRRSVTASEILTSHGFKKVFNITGGIMEYRRMNYPVK